MESVTLTRTFDASPDAVTEQFDDLETFMLAAGFDDVAVDGDRLHIENGVGIATIELTLRVVDDPDCELAYEQVEGIFEEMTTTYAVSAVAGGTEVTARTEFALDVALVGSIMDATVIERQRTKELEAQFEWLADAVGD